MSWCLTQFFQEGWSLHWKVWCLLHTAQWEKGQFELSWPIQEDVITRFEANLNWSSCWETLWTSPPLTTALAPWTPHSSSPGEGCQKRPKTRLEMRLKVADYRELPIPTSGWKGGCPESQQNPDGQPGPTNTSDCLYFQTACYSGQGRDSGNRIYVIGTTLGAKTISFIP